MNRPRPLRTIAPCLAAVLLSACFDLAARLPPPPADLALADALADATDGDAGRPDAASESPPVVFVTSKSYVAYETPPEVADGACNELAVAAGLEGTFVAWLGRDRPMSEVLQGSGGWVRTDGLPVATLTELLAGRMFHPIALDENGNDVRFARIRVITGTSVSGKAFKNCEGFTKQDAEIKLGSCSATTGASFDTATTDCSVGGRLYCFEVGRRGALPLPSASGRLLFVSSSTLAPGGGLAAADALCQKDADIAQLDGTFRALLSAEQPINTRLAGAGEPWVRPDHVMVATSVELVNGKLRAPINVGLAGNHVSGTVWTGAKTMATTGQDCSDWTASDREHRALVGLAEESTDLFINKSVRACDDTPQKIYCFEDR